MHEPLLFLAGCITLLFAPGPTNALMFAAGARGGWRPALVLALVVLCAYALSVLVARLALEPVLAAFPLLARAARVLIGFYVLWLAHVLWSSAALHAASFDVRRADVFITTLLNPKGFILAFVLLPPGGPEIWPYGLGAGALVLAACLSWAGAGMALKRAAGAMGSRLAPRLSAIALGAFGGLAIGSAFG